MPLATCDAFKLINEKIFQKNPNELTKFMQDTLFGLHYLVSNGKYHLDIKPQNMGYFFLNLIFSKQKKTPHILLIDNNYCLADYGCMKEQNMSLL